MNEYNETGKMKQTNFLEFVDDLFLEDINITGNIDEKVIGYIQTVTYNKSSITRRAARMLTYADKEINFTIYDDGKEYLIVAMDNDIYGLDNTPNTYIFEVSLVTYGFDGKKHYEILGHVSVDKDYYNDALSRASTNREFNDFCREVGILSDKKMIVSILEECDVQATVSRVKRWLKSNMTDDRTTEIPRSVLLKFKEKIKDEGFEVGEEV